MRRPRGFTLLEVLIAFVIAGLALAALTEAALGGLHATQAAAHVEEALSRARSRLAAAALNPRPGEQSGDDGGGFTWRVLIRPAATEAAEEGARRPVLYDIQVEVAWTLDGGTRRVTLETMRLGSAAAEGS